MDPVDRLIQTAVDRRLKAMSFEQAIRLAADGLGLDPERVLAAWQAPNPAQQRTLDFFALDHGEYRLHSLLPGHPLAQKLDLGPGHLIADFGDHCWLIHREGHYSLIH